MDAEKQEAVKQKFHWGCVLTLSLGHLMHDTYSSFLAPILPLLIKKLGLSYSMAGLLAVFQRVPSLINPFIGLLAERVTLRYFVIIAPTVTAIVMSLLPLSPNYVIMAMLLLIMGFSSAFFHVPAPVMVRWVSGKRIGTGMSFYMMGGELARSIGPLVILGAISLWGMEGTYKLIPFGAGASLFLYVRLKNICKLRTAHVVKRKRSAGKAIRELRGFFLLIAGLSFSRAIIATALTAFLPTYLTDQGSSLWLAGISLSILELAGAAGTFASGSISDLIGRRNMLLIQAVAAPLLMVLFIFSTGFWLLPVLVALGFFIFASTPVLLALVQEKGHDYPAVANGIFMTLNFIIGSFTIMIIGGLSDWLGMKNSYLIAAGFSFSGIPLVMMLKEN